ncbi:MAG: integrase, partial [Methylocystaceae bacterium]|nr:integrase [Methylocystaceae bacterium]
WKHIDLRKGVWTIPFENLKDSNTRKESFRVPLCPRVVEILEDISKVSKKGLVFPTPSGEPMSNGAMLGLINRMNSGDQKWNDPDGRRIVPHGFRATFKTWGKETRKDRDLIEEALGHVVGTTAERAYDRSDVLELRRELMTAWGAYCEPKSDNVIIFGRSAT